MKELFLVVLILVFVSLFCGFLSGIVYGQSRMLAETSISSVIITNTPDHYPSDQYPLERTFFDQKHEALF